MRSALKTVSGFAMLVSVWVLVWAMAGRPTLDAARVGSGLQAVGAAVELYAVVLIVWRPWVRPRVARAGSALRRTVRKYRRRLHEWFPSIFPAIPTEVVQGEAHLTGTGTLRAEGFATRGGPLEERMEQVEEGLGKLRNEVERRHREQGEQLKRSQAAVGEQLTDLKTASLQVRTEDALRLLLGIALSLIGAAWASIG
jgi:hypothetical protein